MASSGEALSPLFVMFIYFRSTSVVFLQCRGRGHSSVFLSEMFDEYRVY